MTVDNFMGDSWDTCVVEKLKLLPAMGFYRRADQWASGLRLQASGKELEVGTLIFRSLRPEA
jgi:hypothetical protein